MDIGGGSTEFVLGVDRPTDRASVDIGCVRMTERHLVDDPPTPAQVAAATADIDAAIARAGVDVPFARAATLVGLAGSVTTVAALALHLPEYDAQVIHHSRIPATEVRRVSDELLAMTRAERAALPVMHPGRVDVIGAGALILRRIMDATGAAEVLVSEHDILDGVARSVASERAIRPADRGATQPVRRPVPMPSLAVTVIGRDRPGIIAEVTGVMAGLGGNLEDSSMTLLRGHFTWTLDRRHRDPARRARRAPGAPGRPTGWSCPSCRWARGGCRRARPAICSASTAPITRASSPA